jgi:cardiolipin synthase
MEHAWIAFAVFIADLIIRLGLSLRIVMRRLAVAVTFAWLILVLLIPFVGAVAYLTLGELRLGRRRAIRAAALHEPFQAWLADLGNRSHVEWSRLGAGCQPLARVAQATFSVPALDGNRVELLNDWQSVFRSLIADIDRAQRTCHLEFYIWNEGGLADEVVQALVRAAGRGVICRVLLDDVGSRRFLRGEQARLLRENGVQVRAALPVNLLRMLFVRFDLRLHRKIVVIDGEIAYTGSLNLVDPRYFKQDCGVGQWVDAMVRVEGPVVESLAVTFVEDWQLETQEPLEKLLDTADVRRLCKRGTSAVQTIPSGPAFESRAVLDVLLMTIYGARREIVLTSPYFLPDESLVTALKSAAQRGLHVTLVLPAKVDSFLVRYASQAYKGDLLQSGVRIALFEKGLLHTKSATVDGELSLFGSMNLDPRSLHLNFEITLAIYDADFTAQLRQLQQTYLAQSKWMSLEVWQARPLRIRLAENSLRLLGPLL